MIKSGKKHTVIKGSAGEIFEDLRDILAGIRTALGDHLGVFETERFINNAVLSSRSEKWAEALKANPSEEKLYDTLEQIGGALRETLAALNAKDNHCESCECREECKDECDA